MEMSPWLMLAAAAGALLFIEYASRMGWIKSVSPDEDDNPAPAPAPPGPDDVPVPIQRTLDDLADDYTLAVAYHEECKTEFDAACERLSTTRDAYREALAGELSELDQPAAEVADVPQP